MDNLIREEDGKIKKCPSNMAKLGYRESYRLFFGYKELMPDIYDSLEEFVSAVAVVVLFFAAILLIPIMPFARCFYAVRRAKKLVAEDELKRAGGNG